MTDPDVVPAEALREVERDLLAVVDMWRGRFEDAAFRETGLHEALRKETGALREAEAAREKAESEVARLREALKAIKRVAYIEAPPVSDEVPAKVWKIAFDALAESGPKTGGHE